MKLQLIKTSGTEPTPREKLRRALERLLRLEAGRGKASHHAAPTDDGARPNLSRNTGTKERGS